MAFHMVFILVISPHILPFTLPSHPPLHLILPVPLFLFPLYITVSYLPPSE